MSEKGTFSVTCDDLMAWLTYYGDHHVSALGVGLSRMQTMLTRLGNPRIADNIITVAGTNGKGSTCHVIKQLLQATDANHRVGLLTSPHVLAFNERIMMNDEVASDASIIDAFRQIEAVREGLPLSFFEVTTLAAFLIFSKAKLHFAVLEVGLGGRFDATNALSADLSIITSIGLDHTAYLGNDLDQIALEKAGVFRPHRPAIYASENPSKVLIDVCQQQQIKLIKLNDDYQLQTQADDESSYELCYQDKTFNLSGAFIKRGYYQAQNAAAAIVAVHQFMPLTQRVIDQTLEETSVLGRMQWVSKSPDVLVDVAHNQASALALSKFVKTQMQNKPIVAIFGALRDKDIDAMVLPLFDMVSGWALVDTHGDRGLKATDLHKKSALLTASQHVNCYQSVQAAYQYHQASDCYILVFGSFHVVSDAIKLFQIKP